MNEFLNGMLNYREGNGVLSVDSMILCLLSTFILSQAVAWVYLRTHRGVSYSGTMARSMIILSLIVTIVMMVIGNNIARAFGLFGALALIRFRTPVKDANDTVFLFFVVAIGIATGTGNILAGAVGTLIISLIFLYLSKIKFGNPINHDGLLRFHLPDAGSQESVIQKILNRHCEMFSLLHLREAEGGSTVELLYQIKMINPGKSSQLASEIKTIAGVSQLSLLIQDGEATP